MPRKRRKFKRNLLKNPLELFPVVIIIVAIISLYSYFQDIFDEYSGEIFASAIFALVGFLLLVPIVFLVRNLLRKREYDITYKYMRNLEHWLTMNPYEFEEYAEWVFGRLGYEAKATKKTGDHGIDVDLKKSGRKYKAQVKQYAAHHKVQEKEVRDFYGSFIDEAKEGFFVTTSDFTQPAYEWARTRPIKVINGTELTKLVSKID